MNWVSIVVFINTSSFITPHIDFTILCTNDSLQKNSFLDQFTVYQNKYPDYYGWETSTEDNSLNLVSDLHARHNEKQNCAEIHSLYFLKSSTERKRMTTTTTPTRSPKQQIQLAELT